MSPVSAPPKGMLINTAFSASLIHPSLFGTQEREAWSIAWDLGFYPQHFSTPSSNSALDLSRVLSVSCPEEQTPFPHPEMSLLLHDIQSAERISQHFVVLKKPSL